MWEGSGRVGVEEEAFRSIDDVNPFIVEVLPPHGVPSDPLTSVKEPRVHVLFRRPGLCSHGYPSVGGRVGIMEIS